MSEIPQAKTILFYCPHCRGQVTFATPSCEDISKDTEIWHLQARIAELEKERQGLLNRLEHVLNNVLNCVKNCRKEEK